MNLGEWAAIGGLIVVIILQGAATIWWAATTNARVQQLQEQSKDHGGLRDIVIEMRAEMRIFQDVIKELAQNLKEMRQPPRSRRPDDH